MKQFIFRSKCDLWKQVCLSFYCRDFCDKKAVTPGMIPFRHHDCEGCMLETIYELNGGFDS